MKTTGLTVDQEKAAILIAVHGKALSDKSVAKQLGIPVATLSSWKRNINFKLRIIQIFADKVDTERTYRAKRIEAYLKPIYRSIRRKFNNEEDLDNMPLKELLRMLVLLHAELRSDSVIDKKFLRDDMGKEENKGSDSEEDSGSFSEMSDAYEENRSGKVVQFKRKA